MRTVKIEPSPTFALAVLLPAALACLAGCAVSQEGEWTRKENRDEISRLAGGDRAAAIESMEERIARHPRDGETLFGLAAAYALAGDLERARDAVRRAVAAGVPLERFVAGPRELLDPLTQDQAFQELLEERPIALVHGPLVGSVTDSSAAFWVRTAREAPVRAIVTSVATGERHESPEVSTRAEADYTAVVRIEGLEPATAYDHRLLIDGEPQGETRTLRTFPRRGAPARFDVAFGGGAAYTPEHERVWTTIAARKPAALLLLGDNVYIDTPQRTAVQRYCYYRRQSVPEWRRLTASVPVFAIWDDHDFGTNDCRGGPEADRPAWKPAVWRTFRENWNNPAYGGGEAARGCWFAFSIGDVDFFLLDGRYYRTAPKAEHPSMLGPVQKRWLLDGLAASMAAFKVIASPVPWASGTKPGSLDTWDGYPAEREEVFAFIEEERIDGVILLSADRHRSDAWRIERPRSYPLYEFESSRLTNIHKHAEMPRALFSYNEKPSFGLLSFDTTLEDPAVIYRVVSIDGDAVHELTVRRSAVRHAEREAEPRR